MPEGPSIVILREQLASFKGKKILDVSGNSKIDQKRMLNQKVVDLRSWGKQFLMVFPNFSLRVHFLLFGSYQINEHDSRTPRLSIKFKNGFVNFYACSVKYLEGSLDEIYDWTADVLTDAWDPSAARKKLKKHPEVLVCDALLDQTIFSGVGNIIKNEVLFRIRVHPCSQIGALSTRKLSELIHQAREYSFDFLHWKKAYVLRKHWLVHTKRFCPRCERRLRYEAHLGTRRRRSFFCEHCQRLYRLETN